MIGIDRIDDDDVWQQQILWLMGHLTTRIRNSCYNCLLLITKIQDGDISKTKRATEAPLMAKQPGFRGLFRSSKIGFLDEGFQDFWISRSSGHITETKRATRDPLVANERRFESFSDFRERKKYFFWFTISGYGGDISDIKRTTRDPLVAKWPNFPELFDFWIRWRYLGNVKSYRRFAGGKMTGISRAF